MFFNTCKFSISFFYCLAVNYWTSSFTEHWALVYYMIWIPTVVILSYRGKVGFSSSIYIKIEDGRLYLFSFLCLFLFSFLFIFLFLDLGLKISIMSQLLHAITKYVPYQVTSHSYKIYNYILHRKTQKVLKQWYYIICLTCNIHSF